MAPRATETAQFGEPGDSGGTVGLGTVSFVSLDQTGGTLAPVSGRRLAATKISGVRCPKVGCDLSDIGMG